MDTLKLNEYLKSYTDNINTSIALINKMEAHKDILRNEHSENFARLLEVNNFLITVNTVTIDCIVILKNYTSKSEEMVYVERLFYVKASYLLFHEFFKSFDFHRKVINELQSESAFLKDQYAFITRKLKEFKSEYEKKIKPIRNSISAHIDRDSINNFKLISTINNSQDGDMLLHFFDLITELNKYLAGLLGEQLQTYFPITDLDPN